MSRIQEKSSSNIIRYSQLELLVAEPETVTKQLSHLSSNDPFTRILACTTLQIKCTGN